MNRPMELTGRPSPATKSDVIAIRADMDKLEASIKGDIKLLKWMIGVVLACVAFPIFKSFFGQVAWLQ